jgi:hypothetical protein
VSKKVKTQASPKPKSKGVGKAPRKPILKNLDLSDVTEEEKEQARIAEAIRLVEEKKKAELLLKDTNKSGVNPKAFDGMYQKPLPRGAEFADYVWW